MTRYKKLSQLIAISHVSRRGTSLRVSKLKKIQGKLGTKEEDIIGYYDENGRIFLKKME